MSEAIATRSPTATEAALAPQLWLDGLSRELLESGALARLIARGVRGVSANLALLHTAIGASPASHALLPALRADFTLGERYRYEPGPPLEAAMTVFGGHDDDRAPEHALRPWQKQTSGAFRVRTFPGGHFYFTPRREPVLRLLADLTRTAAGARPQPESENLS